MASLPLPPCSIIYPELLTPHSYGRWNTHTHAQSSVNACAMCWQWYFWGFVLRRDTGSFSIECNTQVRDYYWRWRLRFFISLSSLHVIFYDTLDLLSHYHNSHLFVVFSLYLRFLTLNIIRTHTYLSSLLYICLTFISQSSILPIKQSISFVSHAFQVNLFLIHLFFLFTPFHIHSLLIFHSSVFPPQPIHLHTLTISRCVWLDGPPLPSHPHTCCSSLSVPWQCLWQG